MEYTYYNNAEIPNCNLNNWDITDNYFKDNTLHNSQNNSLIKIIYCFFYNGRIKKYLLF